MQNIDNLSYNDREVLLNRLLYHMSQEVRGVIIREHPMIYAKLHGAGEESLAKLGNSIRKATIAAFADGREE